MHQICTSAVDDSVVCHLHAVGSAKNGRMKSTSCLWWSQRNMGDMEVFDVAFTKSLWPFLSATVACALW